MDISVYFSIFAGAALCGLNQVTTVGELIPFSPGAFPL